MNQDFTAVAAVLSYNHPNLTERSVRSLESELPVVLLHNGSDPKNVAHLNTHLTSIIHLSLPSNRGFAGGASYLLDQAFQKANWVLFLSNDCELQSKDVQPPDAPGIYAVQILRRNSGKMESLGGLYFPKEGRLRHCRNRTEFEESKEALKYIPGAAFWMDRSSWQRLKGFNKNLHTYWEDVEISIRAQQLKIQIGIHPQTVVRHGIGKTCHKDAYYTAYLYQRNRCWMSRRNTQGSKRIQFLVQFFVDQIKTLFQAARVKDWARLHWSFLALRDGFKLKIPLDSN